MLLLQVLLLDLLLEEADHAHDAAEDGVVGHDVENDGDDQRGVGNGKAHCMGDNAHRCDCGSPVGYVD